MTPYYTLKWSLHVSFDHLCTYPVCTAPARDLVEETASSVVFKIPVMTGIELVWVCLLLFLRFQYEFYLACSRNICFIGVWYFHFMCFFSIFKFPIKYSLPAVQIRLCTVQKPSVCGVYLKDFKTRTDLSYI